MFFLLSMPAIGGIVYIPEDKLPNKVLVFYPSTTNGVELDEKYKKVIRAVFQNFLVGKGYTVLYGSGLPDDIRNLNSEIPDSKVLQKLDVDGFFTITVYDFADLDAVVVKSFKLDAEVCLFNRKGRKLGCWRDEVSRRNVGIVTNFVGLAVQVLNTALSDPVDVRIRDVIFDWAYKVSILVPGFSYATKKPKIFRVVSNVSKDRIFKVGDKLIVIMEGEQGLKGSFDIGTFRKNIEMIETEVPGVYKGIYTVQEGDKAKDQYIVVKLKKNGEETKWFEAENPVNIDGVPPQPPSDLNVTFNGNSILLSWKCSDPTVRGFIVFRSNVPLGGYKKIAEVQAFNFVDKSVSHGKSYYYRVVAYDEAGNISVPAQKGPVVIPVEKGVLEGELPQVLEPGYYEARSILKVPSGRNVSVNGPVTISFPKGGKLLVEGKLKAKGLTLKPIGDMWDGVEVKERGVFIGEDVKILKAKNALLVDGKVSLKDFKLKKGERGVVVANNAQVSLDKGRIEHFDVSVFLEGGGIAMSKVDLVRNRTAILVEDGELHLEKLNFIENALNVNSKVPVVLKTCYLGNSPFDFKVKGKVKIRSYLTLPYPDGEEVLFSKEKVEKVGKKLLVKGIKSFQLGNFGRACEYFEEAYAILGEKKEVLFWLIYTYISLEEEEKMERILRIALKNYPYEVRFYRMAIKYYLSKNNFEKAKKLLERAIKLQPNNEVLKNLRSVIDSNLKGVEKR